MGFLSQWKIYLDELIQHSDPSAFKGRKLDATAFEKVCINCRHSCDFFPTFAQMSAEQLSQLYELMHATKDIWKPVEEVDNSGKRE
jgi:hypothetical protein